MSTENSATTDQVSHLKATLANIRHHIDIVAELIAKGSLDDAHVYPLPSITKEEEKARMLAHRHFLTGEIDSLEEPPYAVQHVSGGDALLKAVMHFQQYRVNVDESSWYAKRLPGVVFVHTDSPSDMAQHIIRINALKAELQAITQALHHDHEKRWEIIHNAIPGFSSSAAFRTLPAIINSELNVPIVEREKPNGQFAALYSVRFNYEHRNQMRKMAYTDVIDRLQRSKDYADKQQRPGLIQQVDDELYRVHQLSKKTQFVQKRPMPAVPIVKVRGDNPNGSDLKMESFVAHSPVLCINLKPPRFLKHLDDYPGRVLKQPEEESDLVLRRLHLYKK